MSDNSSKMCINIFCGLIISRCSIYISEQTKLKFSSYDCIMSLLLNCLSSVWVENNKIAFGRQRGITLAFIFLLNSDIEMGELLIYGRGSCCKSNVDCVKSLYFSAQ